MLLLAVVQALGIDSGGEGDAGFAADVDGEIGVDADFDTDSGFDADGMPDGGLGAALASLIGFGRVPLTIWLAVLLLFFSAAGVGIQAFADGLIGAPLNVWLASFFAGVLALPVTGVFVRPLARILPRDESSAVTLDTLVGRRAEIVTGRARAAYPARSKVVDHFGQPHFVMVEPHDRSAEFVEGEKLLLVRREGDVFFATSLEDRRLSPAN